ncbi:MAG: hypothetical protein RIM99_14560 [Cyclobacteriaceae bacterium]
MKNTSEKKEVKEQEETTEVSAQVKTTSPEQDKLDAVRELLFGQNVKEYREEIQEVKDLTDKNRSEANQSIESTKVEILQKLDQLSKQFEERSAQIEKKVETLAGSSVDRNNLAALLKDIASRLES